MHYTFIKNNLNIGNNSYYDIFNKLNNIYSLYLVI